MSAARGEANVNYLDGRHGHPLYQTYMSMVRRCTVAGHRAFPRYGGRGITVCQRWLDDFWSFAADMGARPPGTSGKRSAYTLDRIDNDGPYSPENCRWASWSEQRRNSRPRARGVHQDLVGSAS